MLTHISGILESIDNGALIIDVNGVGYAIRATSSLVSEMSSKIGQKVKIYTYFHVKEDSQALYGFLSKPERHVFKNLLSVSGVGPKTALSLLSSNPVDQLVVAITKGSVEILSAAPGIGKKTAERVIVELKEKLSKEFGIKPSEMAKGMPGEEPMLQDAISALMTLGYSPREARQAILKAGIDVNEKVGIEEVIKRALKVSV
jgi:Holliday junction DNA helicase RuvA